MSFSHIKMFWAAEKTRMHVLTYHERVDPIDYPRPHHPVMAARDFNRRQATSLIFFNTLVLGDIIQILTGTVMKYHVLVDCQESYISQGIIFSRSAQH